MLIAIAELLFFQKFIQSPPKIMELLLQQTAIRYSTLLFLCNGWLSWNCPFNFNVMHFPMSSYWEDITNSRSTFGVFMPLQSQKNSTIFFFIYKKSVSVFLTWKSWFFLYVFSISILLCILSFAFRQRGLNCTQNSRSGCEGCM